MLLEVAFMKTRIDSRIKGVIERDSEVMINTTREHYPFVASHGEGDFAYDISGNKFIDFSSFIGVYTLGVNANKQVRDAVKKQLDNLTHPAFTDFYSEHPVAFTEKLLTMFPKGFGRAFYSNSGTEANEAALKFAKIFTKRPYIISFYNAFHGRTMGSLGLTASKAIQKEHFGPFPNVVHAHFPNPYRCELNHDKNHDCASACIDYLKRNILAKEVPAKEIAAIFIEPIQGEGGYIIPPKGFFKQLRELADEHGILLVADEVQSGYMRTGKFLALDNFGIEADIYTMAKALGGGMPIGATITRKSLGNIPTGSHANTFGGNLASIAAADASLTYLKKNFKSLESAVKTKGAYALKRLNEMKDKYEIVGDARGIGLMLAIELVKNKKSKEPAIQERAKVIDECFMTGLLLLPAGISAIRIIPPITISQQNLENGLDILEEAIKKASK